MWILALGLDKIASGFWHLPDFEHRDFGVLLYSTYFSFLKPVFFSFQGLLMLWRGMLPALYRHAIYTGIRMSAYEEIRDTLVRENKVRKCLARYCQLFVSCTELLVKVCKNVQNY